MSKFHSNLLSITKQSWELFKRMFARSVALAALTMLGLAALDYLVNSGMTDRYALIRRFPEFIPLLMASVTLTFIEMSVFWIRFSTQPSRFDIHEALREVVRNSWEHPGKIVAIYAITTFIWAFRVGILIFLAK